MNKKKMIIRLSIILLVLIGVYFEMTEWAPNRVGVRNIHLASSEIPASFDNVSIALISDINSSADNLSKAKKHFDNMKPDVLIFTGDLFEETSTDELASRIRELLSSMEAPLGKFAILSPNDNETSRQILVDSGFTIVSNNSFKLYNRTSESIRVSFYDSTTPSNFPKEAQYSLGFAYDANTFDLVKDDNLDVFVGGKTLGGGVNLPFFGSLTQNGRTSLSSQQGVTKLIVSQGIGTPGADYRLLSSPEIVILSLEHLNEVLAPVEPPPVEPAPETPVEETPVPETPVEETPADEEPASEDSPETENDA